MAHRVVVLSPFWNAGAFLAECVRSICAQEYEGDIELFLLDDASTDGAMGQLAAETTAREIATNTRLRIHRHRSDARRGMMANLHDILRAGGSDDCGFDDDDVIAIVDGDDYLVGTRVFGVINSLYDGGALVTYGQYVYSDGRRGHCERYPAYEFARLRRSPWRASHLKTFKYKVMRAFFAHDPEAAALKDANGEFFRIDGDFALMLPLLELAGFKRVAFNSTVVYGYRRHANNDDALPSGRKAQLATEVVIRCKPAFPCVFSV